LRRACPRAQQGSSRPAVRFGLSRLDLQPGREGACHGSGPESRCPVRPALVLPAPPAQAATDEQLLATCRSYDVSQANAAAACQALGQATRKGENEPGKVIDWPKALWFHDRACTLGSADGCISAGFLYSTGKVGTTGNPPQPGLLGAFTYYRRGCELSAPHCFVQASMHETGKGTAKNLALADSLYARACTASPASCGIYADFMLRRSDVKPDPVRVAGAYRAACEPGRVARACSALAGLIETGKAQAAAPGEAAKLRQSACTLDKAQCQGGPALAAAKPAPAAAPKPKAAPAPAAKPAEEPDVFDKCNKSPDKQVAAKACQTIGFTLEMDMGAGPDHEGAGRFFHRACSLGLGSGCKSMGTKFSFGEIGASGNPPTPNHKLAVVYFRKACDLDPKECTWLGGSYQQGEGVAKDLAEALRLHTTSCTAKDGFGCNNAAALMDKLGSGTPAQVLQLYMQGCDLDNTSACAEASKRHERGIGVKANRAKAAALRSKACGMDYFKSLEKGFCPADPAKTKAGS
jgi:TPR repeat protein